MPLFGCVQNSLATMSRRFSVLSTVSCVWLYALSTSSALTYHISYLEDEGKRAQITQVMDEAVAAYNATTQIDVDVDINVI